MTDLPVIVASLVALVGALGGVAAFMRAGADRSKVIVEAANTVVGMLSVQVTSLDARLIATDARLMSLEVTVGSWELWASRCLNLLDRAISLLESSDDVSRHIKIVELSKEASKVKEDQPTRHGSSHSATKPD